jgi:ketosteroid isomerase-like protein
VGTNENRQLITEAFAAWSGGDSQPFFGLVAADVTWNVIGSTSVSGSYASKAAFDADALGPLTERLDGGVRIKQVLNIFADGDHVIVQFESSSRARTGMPYEQSYCWVLRLADGEIVEVTAYLDTELLAALFAE